MNVDIKGIVGGVIVGAILFGIFLPQFFNGMREATGDTPAAQKIINDTEKAVNILANAPSIPPYVWIVLGIVGSIIGLGIYINFK